MADDQHSGVTRRRVLAQGAMAAGVVWSTPVVRSVSRLGAVGTPAPPTSDTEPSVTHYSFAGSVGGRDIDRTNGPCTFNVVVTFTAELSTLGTTDGRFELCVEVGQPLTFEASGTALLSAAGGTVAGTAVGNLVVHNGPSMESPPLTDVHLTMTIAGGTGTFEGAVGTALYDDREQLTGTDPEHLFVVFSGELSGSFDVPS